MKKTAGFIAIVLVIALCGCSPAPGGISGGISDGSEVQMYSAGYDRYEASFIDAFDTITMAVVYAESEAAANAIFEDVHGQLYAYHQLYDIYNTYAGMNNIKTVNDSAGGAPVSVDSRIIELVQYCISSYAAVNGRMNIALGSVLSIWHEYRERGVEDPINSVLPDMETLRSAALHTDINCIETDEQAGTIRLSDPDMRLDVGAAAKGYACEMICRDLRDKGVERFLISVGGNVCAIGQKTQDEPWSVVIQDPDSPNEYLYKLGLADMALVTSGDYQRYYTVDGVRYHHIIDPDTLMPSEYFTAVSVLSGDSALADVLSTALFNMPLSEGRSLVEATDGVEAMWVNKDGSHVFSDGFEKYIIH